MSDDLTPAEQARAHRLSAQALYERNPNAFEASRYALGEIADHLDPPEPLETVESLRAEQDKVVAQFEMVLVERNNAREDVEYWREQFRLVCDESANRKNELARLRSTHTEAEAAWERCKR